MNCNTCKYAEQTNVYCEGIDGKLIPLHGIFIAYCPKLEEYVAEKDHCKQWKHILEDKL